MKGHTSKSVFSIVSTTEFSNLKLNLCIVINTLGVILKSLKTLKVAANTTQVENQVMKIILTI